MLSFRTFAQLSFTVDEDIRTIMLHNQRPSLHMHQREEDTCAGPAPWVQLHITLRRSARSKGWLVYLDSRLLFSAGQCHQQAQLDTQLTAVGARLRRPGPQTPPGT